MFLCADSEAEVKKLLRSPSVFVVISCVYVCACVCVCVCVGSIFFGSLCFVFGSLSAVVERCTESVLCSSHDTCSAELIELMLRVRPLIWDPPLGSAVWLCPFVQSA